MLPSTIGSLGINLVFLVQAEDGIRDLVRSRGLGDVYKRQCLGFHALLTMTCSLERHADIAIEQQSARVEPPEAVSYTHLTLPTSDLV